MDQSTEINPAPLSDQEVFEEDAKYRARNFVNDLERMGFTPDQIGKILTSTENWLVGSTIPDSQNHPTISGVNQERNSGAMQHIREWIIRIVNTGKDFNSR